MALGALDNFIVLQTTEEKLANATQQSNKEKTGKRRKYRYRPHVDTSSSEEELDDQGRPKRKKRSTKKIPTSKIIQKNYFYSTTTTGKRKQGFNRNGIDRKLKIKINSII